MEDLIRYLQVNSDDIAMLKFLLEGYEGLAILTTVDQKNGVVSLGFPAALAAEVNEVLSGLATEVAFAEIPLRCALPDHPSFDKDMERSHA